MLAYSVATKSFLQRNARAIVCSNKDKTRKSNSRYRIRKAARTYIASVGFGTIILLFGFKLFCEQIWGSSSDQLAWNKNSHIVTSRSILWQAGENETKCSPPSIQEFPTELFSIRQLKHGGVLLHIAVSVYMFIALAFVCDDYFVASLDKICEHLKLSEDIAGATFMAAGSSAPELFTSLIGLFIVHGDVGTGTIVGSAVFNVLIILALVSLWAGQIVKGADCFLGDEQWSDYLVGYLAVMKFNKKLMKLFKVRSPEEEIEEGNQALDQQREGTPGEDEAAIYRCGSPESYELVAKRLRRLTWREVGMMIMLSSQFPPATRFRAACYMITLRQENEHKGLLDSGGESETENNSKKTAKEHEMGSIDVQIEGGPFMDQDRSVFGLAFWLFSRPIIILLYYTIPDCKKEKWERFYLATFFMSIVWIAVFSYIMVWMVTVVGFVLGIPDVIMGITFLAAGTSIPDAIASLIVSRQGLGDMAVSNSIGSNVFDILIGLAFPWFIHTAIISPGSEVSVNSRGLKYSVILLLGSVLLTSVYMFIALAFVCDDYFVASLDHICENLNLSEDVAGATFMAVGGSAPELFTSVIGLFVIGYGDVGPGTIVGSAVFNILVALGLVSFFAGQVTQLTRWPILRDSLSYSVAIAALIGAMYDGFITWYESLIMLLLYAGYITLMKFNSTVLKIIQPESVYVKEEEKNPLSNGTVDYGSTMLENGDIPAYCGSPDSYQLVTKKIRKLTWREVGMMVMLSDRFQPATRFRAACYMVTMRQDDGHEHQNESDTNQNEPADIVSKNSFKQWARWYMVTFLMSIIWIGALSYIMVWMVVIIGYTLGIPDVIMGITFLAAGSSVPDALASLIVSRQGQGDMATANSIGSNVFDILIGLALPWFFQTALLHPGSRVADRTGSINASIWDDFGVHLQAGDIIRFCKGYAQVWKNQLTIYTGRTGYLEKIGEFCMLFSEYPNMSDINPEFINIAKQNLGDKHQTNVEASSNTIQAEPSPVSQSAMLPQHIAPSSGRYHPYQRENSHPGVIKSDSRADPRLLRKQGTNGAKEKPKDPRLAQQIAAQTPPRPPVVANLVNTNRDPRQRR
eukprot:gene13513-4393_t